MNYFKVGDRVTYVGPMRDKRDRTFTIKDVLPNRVAVEEESGFTPWFSNLRHVTPDVITINRADLPKVTEVDGSLHCGENHYFTDPKFGAAKHRQLALQQLAVAEFIEARDKAAEEAIHKRDERRADLDCLSRTALIECIIELEASHD